jgi:adenine phosphoribosyltransferase
LAARLAPYRYDVLLTAEAKSIPLAHALAVQTGRPYIVLRKTYKGYMGQALKAQTLSITTGQTQTLYLDEKDIARVAGHAVVLLDDVVSTGSTLAGMRQIVAQAKASVSAVAAILTEGDDPAEWQDVIALGTCRSSTSQQPKKRARNSFRNDRSPFADHS